MSRVKSIEELGLKLLPPKSDLCQECATKHHPNEPHNKNSLFYQIDFKIKHGRDPNWEDAMSHCNEGLKQLWREELAKIQGKSPEGRREGRR